MFFCFDHLDLFRISDFEFGICKFVPTWRVLRIGASDLKGLCPRLRTIFPLARDFGIIRLGDMDKKTLLNSGKKVEKSWGYEIIWAHTDHYVGKILHIRKAESLSYQYHEVKDETIHLLGGSVELEVEVEGVRDKIRLEPGQGFRITPGTKHRMMALEDCDILEASTPELDDVVRLEDRYGRVGRKND